MPDTINDISVPSDSWVNVYTATGITQGKSITITNKSSYDVLIRETSIQPLPSSMHGPFITDIDGPSYQATISCNPSGIWLKSAGSYSALVNVQEI